MKRDLSITFKQQLNPLLVLAKTIENRKNVINMFEKEEDISRQITLTKLDILRDNLAYFENELAEYIEDYRKSEKGFPVMNTEQKIKIGLIKVEHI